MKSVVHTRVSNKSEVISYGGDEMGLQKLTILLKTDNFAQDEDYCSLFLIPPSSFLSMYTLFLQRLKYKLTQESDTKKKKL